MALWTDPREAKALKTQGALLGVTVGSRPLIVGTNWQKAVLSLFPDLQKHVGGVVLSSPYGTPERMVVWENTRFVPARTSTGLPAILISNPGPKGLIAVSEDGSALRSLAPRVHWSGGPTGYEVTSYPRRGRWITLRGEPEAGDEADGLALTFQNPVITTYPVWKPEPLPAIREVDSVKFVLDRFATGLEAKPTPDAGTTLGLRVLERGAPAGDRWHVEAVQISDATGNAWNPELDGSSELRSIRVPPRRLPDEAAFDIKVDVARLTGFHAREVWSIPGLIVPKPKSGTPLRLAHTLNGCRVEVTAIEGAGAKSKGWTSRTPFVRVRVSDPEKRFFLRSRSGSQPFAPESADSGEVAVSLGKAKPGSPVRLQLAVTPRVSFEFRAAPQKPADPSLRLR